MLDMMRRHSQSYLIYFFFGVLIVVFVFFFGPQSEGCVPSQTGAMATVGDVDIDSTQIEQLYSRVYSRENRGGSVETPAPLRKRSLTEDIVLVHLLAREAREAGLDVNDVQLSAYVRGPRNLERGFYYDPRTQTFDLDSYQLGVAGNFGMPLAAYESYKAAEYLAIEYMGLLANSIAVAPAEVETLYRLRNTEYTLAYVELNPRDMAEYLAVPEADVDTALAENEAGVRAYFDANIENYTEERQLRFRRILVQIDPNASEAERTASRTSYDEALAAVTADPESFSDVASEYSSGSEASEGGDLGWKSASNYALFSGLEGLAEMSVGDIETYESETSLIIYRFADEQPEVVAEFDDIAREVALAMLTEERGDEPLAEIAAQLREEAVSSGSLEEAVAALSLRLDGPVPEETPDAPPEDLEPTDGQTDDGEPADAPDTGEGDASEADTADEPVEEPALRLTDLLETEETRPFAIDRPDPYAQFAGQIVISGSSMPNPETIPGLGDIPALARQLSTLSIDNPVAPEVYRVDDKLVVAALVSVEQPDDEIDDETYQVLADELRGARVRYLFGDWDTRILAHRQAPLSPYLQHLLNAAIEDGVVDFEESFFVWEPEPEESAEDAEI